MHFRPRFNIWRDILAKNEIKYENYTTSNDKVGLN